MALKTNNHESRLTSTVEKLQHGGNYARKAGHATLEKLRWGPELTDDMLYPNKPPQEPLQEAEPLVPADHLFTHDVLHSGGTFVAHPNHEPEAKNEKRPNN